MGPKGQWHPGGNAAYYYTVVSVENVEFATRMWNLYSITGDARYKAAAIAAEKFLFNKTVTFQNGDKTKPVIVQGYEFTGSQWQMGKASASDVIAWLILGTDRGDGNYSNLQTLDEMYGEGFIYNLVKNSIDNFGVFDSQKNIVEMSFSQESAQRGVGSFEWSRFWVAD